MGFIASFTLTLSPWVSERSEKTERPGNKNLFFFPLCCCYDYVCVYCRFLFSFILLDWLCLIVFAHQEWKNEFWLPVCMHLYERGKHGLNPDPNLVRQLDGNFEVSLIHRVASFFSAKFFFAGLSIFHQNGMANTTKSYKTYGVGLWIVMI